MKTIKIEMEFSTKEIMFALKTAAKRAYMKLEKEPDWKAFAKEMSEDIKLFLQTDLEQFFYDGIANDAFYIKYLK